MKSLSAFIKKEFMEHMRSGKLLILGILFVVFGIMNPAVAKLTPALLEIFSDSLAQSGMVITGVTVSAMDSWVQFFKNMPMGLIVFILLESNIFTKEYTSGSLVISLTKGLERYKVIISKTVVIIAFWTIGYWLCFGITYAYNAYFWDNSVAQNLMFSVVSWWMFGIFTISLMILFSVLSRSNIGVLCSIGGVVFISYLFGFLPKLAKYLPTYLTDGNSLIYGVEKAEHYIPAIIIAAVISVVCFGISIPIFNKKQL